MSSSAEKERMRAGELYRAEDALLVEERRHAAEVLVLFNAGTGAMDLLRPMLGASGSGSSIRPPFFCDYGYNIELGAGVFLNFGCVLLDVCKIRIGDGTQIGPGVQLYAADHPRDAGLRRSGLENGREVHIGRNVWIGGGAIVLPGVHVGDDAIVGAGSVVTRDIPEGATVMGNPARLRGQRS